ncbi:collagen triple helix repeat-containing protein, partial [Cellulophaga geojensis KL-A]
MTLEDQCNCEVLSGTDVTVAGMTSPAGADLGDVYVNTDTGVIYFWDGNSWELTSTDDQQIQDFSFDSDTNTLTLQLENGGTSSVDLTSLHIVETLTTIMANTDGTFTYRDEDGVDTVIDIKDLETLTVAALNADNTNIDYTDEDGNTTQLDLTA